MVETLAGSQQHIHIEDSPSNLAGFFSPQEFLMKWWRRCEVGYSSPPGKRILVLCSWAWFRPGKYEWIPWAEEMEGHWYVS
jgi:hypothetical protein